MKTTRWGAVIGAVALACVTMTSQAQASTIQFTFDCQIIDATHCTSGGPSGTLTLKDSTVDPNRVDMDIVLNEANLPGTITGLNKFFVNYNNAIPVVSGLALDLVTQATAAGVVNGVDNIGGGSVSLNNEGPLHTTLDIQLNPETTAATATFTYSASLVLHSTAPGHVESNLDASMFDLLDADNLLYAAFNTFPSAHSPGYGAEEVTTGAVPEPSSLILLGSGLFGLIRLGARRRARRA